MRRAGSSVGGFYARFKDKNELARALLQRYIVREDAFFDDLFGRAHELHDDPLHAFLIGLKMFSEMMADLPESHPGCLVATFCYNERMFDQEIRALNKKSVLDWRRRFRTMLEEIAALYPPRKEIDLDALADMVSNTVEGGIIMSKALHDPKILAEQILLFRSYVKLLFLPGRG